MARVRRRQGTKEALQGYEQVILDPMTCRGRWQELFGNEQPIYIEVGTGRGRFISTMARQHPECNFIGIDVVEEMVLEAVERMEKQGGLPSNLRMVWLNAELLNDIFAPGEVARLYLNFSDPWPKYRHRKRRLTHERFLAQYAEILAEGGELHQKTDNQGFFEYSLNTLAGAGWQLKNIRLDLYKKLPEDNVATEYETKYVRQGLPIYRLEAVRPARKIPEVSADFSEKILTYTEE